MRERTRAVPVVVMATVAVGVAYALSLVPEEAGVRPWVVATSALATAGAVGCLALSLRTGPAPLGAAHRPRPGRTGAAPRRVVGLGDRGGRPLGPFDAPYQPVATTAAAQAAWQRDVASWPALAADAARVPSAESVETDETSAQADGAVLASGREFLSVGGFTGQVPSTPLRTFVDDVRHRRVVDVVVPVAPLTRNPDMRWALAHCDAQDGTRGNGPHGRRDVSALRLHTFRRRRVRSGERQNAIPLEGLAPEATEPTRARGQTSRKRRIAMAEPMEPIAMPTMTTTTLVSRTSDPDMCIAVKMLLVVRRSPRG